MTKELEYRRLLHWSVTQPVTAGEYRHLKYRRETQPVTKEGEYRRLSHRSDTRDGGSVPPKGYKSNCLEVPGRTVGQDGT